MIDRCSERGLVCLGEPHGLRTLADFVFSLLRDPGFAAAVDDIVVEWGNRAYQDVADRFTAGEDVPPARLLPVWRNTTQPGMWDAPMYGRLFVRVREINGSLPPERRLRVVLADPAIDWNSVASGADFAPYAAVREAHFAAVIESEVLRKGRRALFWAGASHVVRRPETVPNPVVLLERRGAKPFVVLAHGGFASGEQEDRLSAWPAPSLLRLKDTWLGRLDASAYFGEAPSPKRGNPYKGVRLEDAADAYLYLGAEDSLVYEPPPEDLHTGAYGEEIRRRRALIAELWKRV